MEKTMGWEQKTLLKELTKGKELTNLLRKDLRVHPCSSPQARHVLLEEILRSYENALSMLNWADTQPIPTNLESPAGSDKNKKDVFKKRKTSSGWTEQIRVCSGTSPEGPLEDGFCWRKYGQKDILGSNFPRGYYRCTHRHSQGCLATKQVQRSDKDPTLFEVKYRGRHTCSQASHFAATSAEFSKDRVNSCRQKQELEDKPKPEPKQSQEIILSFRADVMVKREDLDSREDIFPSFAFPIEEPELEANTNMLVNSIMDNEFMGSLSPIFMSPSPATSESNYFAVLGQSVPTSESDLTEILSAPTSVTNSPIGDLDISSLDKLEFDPSFPFYNPIPNFFP